MRMSFDAHNIEVGVSLYSGMAAKRQKGPLHKSLSNYSYHRLHTHKIRYLCVKNKYASFFISET